VNYLAKTDNLFFITSLPLGAFLISGGLVVLCWSPNVLGNDQITCWALIIPWMLLGPLTYFNLFSSKEFRTEIVLLLTIIIFGIINIVFSDNPARTYPTMRMFLLTGVITLWTSMFLLAGRQPRQLFDWFCCGCLAIIALTEILACYHKSPNAQGLCNIFTLHSIPLGSLIILLSPGPFRLLGAADLKWKAAGCLLLALGVFLITLTGKRSTFWVIVAMCLFWVYFRAGRWSFLAAVALVTVTLLVPKGLNFYKSLHRDIPSHNSIFHRLELYPFSLHVYLKHPVAGIGLRSLTHEKYLADFPRHNSNLQTFQPTVKQLQTFDNMLLTAFVELGTPMTLAYLAKTVFILRRYWQRLRPLARSPGLELYRLLVVLGFAVHSLAYDSMLFPSVNWLFHVQLGILAGYGLNRTPASLT